MAEYTGWFPYEPQVKGGPYYMYTKQGAQWKRSGPIQNGEPLAGNMYADILQGAISNTTNMSTRGFDPSHFGPFGVRVSGKPKPVPPVRVLSGPVVKVNNKPFIKRKNDGEIVVSDYKRFQALLTYRNGGIKKNFGEIAWFGRDCRSLATLGFIPEPGAAYNAMRMNSNQAIGGVFKSQYRLQTVTDDLTPFDVGWDDSVIQSFLDGISVPDDSSSVVSETLSEANAATVDILTAMAEMPETVKSIIQGCMAVLKLFKDAKKREFSILTKEKRVRYEHEQKLFRVNFESRQAWLQARNERARRIIENKRQASVAQLRADLRKTLKSFADAIASVWLTFRYGILPNVYLIEGLVESLDEMDKKFERWRNLEHVTFNLPKIGGWTCSAETASAELRCMIKRKFEHSTNLGGLLRQYSANAFLTAWELIPLSFVIDWFVNIGNVLSASFGNNQFDYVEAATLSLKVQGVNFTYSHESGASVSVEVKGYLRNVIDPRDFCRFEFSPDVSGYRVNDAIALSWNLAVSKLFEKS